MPEADPRRTRAAGEGAHPRGSRLPRLLIVGLGPPTREVLYRHLSMCGFSVFEADSVEDALRLVEAAGVEVLVTNTRLLAPGAGLREVRSPSS